MDQKRPLTCVWPKGTRAVSVTGPHCSRDCPHCGGHYLTGMADFRAEGPAAATARKSLADSPAKSLLVSGGCDAEGRVPLSGEALRLQGLKERFRLNAHPGLVDEARAAEIAGWADVASLDFVADAATLAEVYGLEGSPERYLAALRALRERLPVVPHVCLGLLGGEIGPEYAALARLSEEGVEDLVILVFIPTPGTRYADRSAPPVEEVAAFLREARRLLPEARLTLGCMRPGGRYREAVDLAAVEAGVDVIVQPALAARDRARALGRPLQEFDECCAFLAVARPRGGAAGGD